MTRCRENQTGVLGSAREARMRCKTNISMQYTRSPLPASPCNQRRSKQTYQELTNAIVSRTHMRHSGAAILHHNRVWAWHHVGPIHTGAVRRLLRDATHRHPAELLALLRVIHHLLLLCGGILDVTRLLLLRWRRRIRTWRKGILRCVHGLVPGGGVGAWRGRGVTRGGGRV